MMAVRKARPPIVSMMPPRALLWPPTHEVVLSTIHCSNDYLSELIRHAYLSAKCLKQPLDAATEACYTSINMHGHGA